MTCSTCSRCSSESKGCSASTGASSAGIGSAVAACGPWPARAFIGRLSSQDPPHSRSAAAASTAARRQPASNARVRDAGSSAVWRVKRQTAGKSPSTRPNATNWPDRPESQLVPSVMSCAPTLSGARGTAGFAGAAGAAALVAFTMVCRVAAKAARLAGSFSTSRTSCVSCGVSLGAASGAGAGAAAARWSACACRGGRTASSRIVARRRARPGIFDMAGRVQHPSPAAVNNSASGRRGA